MTCLTDDAVLPRVHDAAAPLAGRAGTAEFAGAAGPARAGAAIIKPSARAPPAATASPFVILISAMGRAKRDQETKQQT